MPIVLDVRFERTGFAERGGGGKRRFNAAMKAGLRRAGERWHRELLPKHFTVGAKTAYRFERRDRVTGEIKQRRGQNPLLDLVADGKTRRYALHAPRITATANKATVRVSVPPYIPVLQRNPNAPPVADELTRVNSRDRRTIASWIDGVLSDHLNRG